MTNTQSQLLTTLITTAHNAMSEAEAGRLFASREGIALFQACAKLFDDDFPTMIANAEHELGLWRDAA